jgi:methionyl-tRNA synthetase
MKKGDFIEQVTSNCMMQKQISSWQTVLLGLAQNAVTKKRMEINVKNVVRINATDLINPKSTITGETPIMKSTKHWFYLWIVMKIS